MGKTTEISMQFKAEDESLSEILMFVDDWARGEHLSLKKLQQLELALEEAVVNVFHYAYPDEDGDGVIWLRLKKDLERHVLEIDIEDEGAPFNPLAKSGPDYGNNLDDWEVGGLGIFLMRRLVDDVLYLRKKERNTLRLILKVK
jgi:serine/threonine-protein kinase RsbW